MTETTGSKRDVLEAVLEQRGRRLGVFEPSEVARVVVDACLRLSLLSGTARRNAADVRLVENTVVSARLPAAFDGFRLLHLSDLHADMSTEAMQAAERVIDATRYDACVITGDFRGRTWGSITATLAHTGKLREHIRGSIWAVLGNHDTRRLVEPLGRMGIDVLNNAHINVTRGDQTIAIAGVDDPHHYRLDDPGTALAHVPEARFRILLAHSPEIYARAAALGADLLLAGHTHGGQICLPGGRAVTLWAAVPRRFGAGPWEYGDMAGYTSRGLGTSLLPARFNCPPEVTVHTLRRPDPV